MFESLGQKTWLLNKDDQIRALVTKIEAKRGTFLFLPYGPMLATSNADSSLSEFFTELRQLAEQEKASFVRISPFWSEDAAMVRLTKDFGFKPAPIHMLAETLWLLDLSGSDEELLQGMEKKHRNLIRRAAKDGVEIRKSNQPDAVERFIDLHWQTVDRHNFTPYPKEFFRHQVQLFTPHDQVLVFETYYQSELIASAIIMYYGQVAAYHHGASSSHLEHRKIPASYLLQWEAILEAKRRNCHSYNFWGIAPFHTDSESKRVYEQLQHPYCGITHFKTGFGGKRLDLMPAHDLMISPKYYLNWVVEKFRKRKRGF